MNTKKTLHEDKKCTCIECKKEFEAYPSTEECPTCNDEGYIEDEDWQRPPYRICWNCKGTGQLKFIEYMFCDESCKESHFEDVERGGYQ